MKHLQLKLLITVILLCISLSAYAQVVNGDTLRIDDKKVLKVWGTHYERGYANGWLMGEQIMEIAVEYIIEFAFNNDPEIYYDIRYFYDNCFSVETKYQQEAQGIIDGMTDSGISLYIEAPFNRYLDVTDLFLANAIVDLSALFILGLNPQDFGCSSLSSWGESTEDDPQLNGQLVITRNMDWTIHQTLLENHLLMVQIPAEEDELPWVSFTFPGLIGALSVINSNDVAAFMNVGNYNNYSNTSNLHPIFFSIRNGIESADYNQDGSNTIDDVASAIGNELNLSGTITHAVQPDRAFIIENNNINGTAVRTIDDNSIISGNNLVATNHFRSLYPPVYCYRYDDFADSLSSNSDVTIYRNWEITTGAGGVSNNLHTMQFVPSLDQASWSTAKLGQPAYTQEPSLFDLNELFEPGAWNGNEIIEPNSLVLSVLPNPFFISGENTNRAGLNISFNLSQIQDIDLTVYNLKGQRVTTLYRGRSSAGDNFFTWNARDDRGRLLPAGLYILHLTADDCYATKKMVLYK